MTFVLALLGLILAILAFFLSPKIGLLTAACICVAAALLISSSPPRRP